MPEFKEPNLNSQSFKSFFDACLSTGQDPEEYAKNNGVDMKSAKFFNELREWSKETSGQRDYKRDMLLYKITQNSNGCCHIDCGGPTCSRKMFDDILEKPHPLIEQNLEILGEVIKSKSVFLFSKPKIITNILGEIFKNKFSPEEIIRVTELLNSVKKLSIENSNDDNPYTSRDFKKLGETSDKYIEKINKTISD